MTTSMQPTVPTLADRLRLSREAREASVFLVCIAVVGLTWLALGFRPGYLAMNNDGVQYFLPLVSVLSDVGGDWQAMTYRPEYFGGTNMLGLYGLLPISMVLAKVGVSAVWNVNLTLFFIQSLLAYFAVQGARMFANTGEDILKPKGLIITCCVAWISVFSTMIAWRIDAGHLYYIVALVAIQAMLTLWITTVRGKLTTFMLVLAMVALVHAFCIQGFQILLYGLVFAGPLLIAVAVDAARTQGVGRAMWPILLCVGAALVSLAMALPVFLEMLRFVHSGDAPRSPGHDVVTYSYFTGSWREIVNALFWFDYGISKLPSYQLLEVNYGLGPVLMLALVPVARKRWIVVAGLAVSILLCVIFITNLQPFAGWLVRSIPFLQDFRVPTRCFLPLGVVWTTIGLGYLLTELGRADGSFEASKWLALAVIAATAVLGLLLPDALKEILIWLLVGAVLYAALTGRSQLAWPLAIAVVLMNLVAFKHHVEMAEGVASVVDTNRELGRDLRSREPALASPLTRVDTDISVFGFNTSAIGKIASINGYGFAHRRFSTLVHDLVNAAYSPTRTYFNATGKIAAFDVVQQLYNIRYRLLLVDEKVELMPLAATPGPVWASDGRATEDGQHALDQMLKQRLTLAGWQQTQYVDSFVVAGDRRYACDGLRFGTPKRDANGRHLTIPVEGVADGPCPVTISMTFASNLQATAAAADGVVQVPLYPAYGTLTGMMMPPRTRSISVVAGPGDYPRSVHFALLGLIAAAGLCWAGRRFGFDRSVAT